MSYEPNIIYLHDPHGYFENEYIDGDNTVIWSEDQMDKNDYKYIRIDNQEKELYEFFRWFQQNGEKYINFSIEKMIDIYLNEKSK